MLNSRHYEDDVGPLFSATICTARYELVCSGCEPSTPESIPEQAFPCQETHSQSVGNASLDTGMPSHIKSGYVTLIKVQINLPEIHIQKVQNPIVLMVIN